jgi:hypothetical protein
MVMVVVVMMMMPNLPTHSFQLAQAAIKDNIQDAGNVETCHWLSGYGSPSLKCQCRGSFPYGGVQESCVAMGTFILRKRTLNRRFFWGILPFRKVPAISSERLPSGNLTVCY